MSPASAEQAAPAFSDRLKALRIQEYGLAAVVVLLFVTGSILKPETFPTWDNVRNMVTQASVVGCSRSG
jgi:ABC-type xylose transport system, permease component